MPLEPSLPQVPPNVLTVPPEVPPLLEAHPVPTARPVSSPKTITVPNVPPEPTVPLPVPHHAPHARSAILPPLEALTVPSVSLVTS